MLAYIREHRVDDGPFEVVIGGHTAGHHLASDRRVVAAYIAAGARW